MPVNYIATTCVIATALLTGCSSSSDDDDTDMDSTDTIDQTSMLVPDADLDGSPAIVSRFDGNYFRSCAVAEDDDNIWETVEMTIQDGIYSSIFTEYGDAQCTQTEFVLTSDVSARFPDGTADTQLGVADFVDFTTEFSTINGQVVPGDNVINFELILLDGNTLYFGLVTEELPGDTAENRPVEIDTNIGFILQ